MVTPGESGIEIPVQGDIHPVDHRFKERQDRGISYRARPPGPPGTEVFTGAGSVSVMTGWTTEMFVVRVAFCPSDCRAVIERI